jgi:hypothetical protein
VLLLLILPVLLLPRILLLCLNEGLQEFADDPPGGFPATSIALDRLLEFFALSDGVLPELFKMTF